MLLMSTDIRSFKYINFLEREQVMRGKPYDLDDVIADLENQYGVDYFDSDEPDYLERMNKINNLDGDDEFSDDLDEFDLDEEEDFDEEEDNDNDNDY